MIITVTPNPSLDRTFDVDVLAVGEVTRAHGTHVHAGGKGINVSRALARHGIPTRAVLPVGGADGAELVDLLAALGVPARAVPVRGATRSNVAVVDARGVTTKVNAAGPTLDDDEAAALVAAVERELDVAGTAGSWLVLAGSVPRGAGADLYPRLVAAATARGIPVAVDASGAALDATVRAGGTALLKPNLDELCDVLGASLTTVGEIVAGARTVLARGHDSALVSLGADGALLVTATQVWWAGGSPIVPRSTVGAGDCTLAGFLATDGEPIERLRAAVAWGRAAVGLPGSAIPGPVDLDLAAVQVVAEPDPALDPVDLFRTAPAGLA